MTNPTDTNQTSEDRLSEIFRNLSVLRPSPKSQTELAEYNRTTDDARTSIQALIRTEKLKLLAEVRERVVGRNQPLPKRGDVSPDIHVEVTHRVEGRNALRAEQLANLTKLEAEL